MIYFLLLPISNQFSFKVIILLSRCPQRKFNSFPSCILLSYHKYRNRRPNISIVCLYVLSLNLLSRKLVLGWYGKVVKNFPKKDVNTGHVPYYRNNSSFLSSSLFLKVILLPEREPRNKNKWYSQANKIFYWNKEETHPVNLFFFLVDRFTHLCIHSFIQTCFEWIQPSSTKKIIHSSILKHRNRNRRFTIFPSFTVALFSASTFLPF